MLCRQRVQLHSAVHIEYALISVGRENEYRDRDKAHLREIIISRNVNQYEIIYPRKF